MFGRGTVDDKGPVMAVLEAVRAYLECGLRPPVTVKFLIEGEEEVGSPSLRPVLEAYHDFLYCDATVNFDDNVWFDGRPRVIGGLKGSCALRLEARLDREFHAMNSPLLAGAAWRVVWALNSLVAPDGRILVRDFFDDVVPPSEDDIELLKGLNWDGEAILRESGEKAFLGGRSPLEALTAFILEPTINLGGLTGGYVQPAKKGVVPAFAAAEMRVGLVPNQTPERVYEKVKQHLEAEGFGDVEVKLLGGNPWARAPMKGEIIQALARSLDAAFGRGIAYQPSYAGSGPEGVFQELFPKMQHAYSGFGPVEDRLHAPNEYIVVDDYIRGIEATARLYTEYAPR
jgi:acetylornithine deacetylase/succinyl-diaminopimelate desuccinylase-like protein